MKWFMNLDIEKNVGRSFWLLVFKSVVHFMPTKYIISKGAKATNTVYYNH